MSKYGSERFRFKRCLFCGEKFDRHIMKDEEFIGLKNYGGCCSEEHKKKFEEYTMKNIEKGLCSCGQPKCIDNGIKMNVCRDCLDRNNKMMKFVEDGLKQLGDEQ